MDTKRIFYILGLFFLLSCTNSNKQKNVSKEINCLPGHIWFFYVGESTKITRFTLIRTCDNDTSYLSSYREGERGFADDRTFFNMYCNNYIADINLFSQLKKYIKFNNTHKEENQINTNNYNAVKIEFRDQCDTIMYVVNESDPDYFSNMIDSLQITDDKLKEYLLYYKGIQKCGDNDIRKW